MPEEVPQIGGLDDEEMAQSIRYMAQERSRKRILSVVVLLGVVAVLATGVYLAYTDTPESAKGVEGGPGGPP